MVVAWIVRVFVALVGAALIVAGVVTKSQKEVALIISGAVIIAWVIYAIIRQLASGLRLEVEAHGDARHIDAKVQLLGVFVIDEPWDFIAAVIAFAGIAIPWFVS